MTKLGILLIVCALFLCIGSIYSKDDYYLVIKQTVFTNSFSTNDLKQYQEINIGWLDLGETNYIKYGYEETEKDAWIDIINDMNLDKLPKYLKKYLASTSYRKIRINKVKTKKEIPDSKGLVIQFSDVNYVRQGGAQLLTIDSDEVPVDSLYLTVHYIDGVSGTEQFNEKVVIKPKGAGLTEKYSFGGRIHATVRNLAQLIAERFTGGPVSFPTDKRGE